MRRQLWILAVFFCLGLGVFYGGAKFHVPWYGGNDFQNYALMAQSPLDNAAQAPFAYRLLTPGVVHFVHRLHAYYAPGRTPFSDGFAAHGGHQYDPGLLGAFIFTNFLFLVMAAYCLYRTMTAVLPPQQNAEDGLAVGLSALLFLSLSTVVHGMSGLTEGGSLLLISLLLFLYHRRYLLPFVLVLLVSIVQRELIALILAVYVLAVSWDGDDRRRDLPYILAALSCFALYFVVRGLIPVAGYDGQLQAGSYVRGLLDFRLSGDFLFQSILANNLLWAAVLYNLAFYRHWQRALLPCILILVILTLLGIGAGIGNNVGRILNLATPILLLAQYRIMRGGYSAYPLA